MLHFVAVGQQLRLLGSQHIVADHYNYIQASFNLSGDWDGLQVWAHFKHIGDDEAGSVMLVNNQITRDMGVNLCAGEWKVSIHGDKYDGDELVERVTSNVLTISVDISGIVDGAFHFDPDEGTQIVARCTEQAEIAAGHAQDAADYAADIQSQIDDAQDLIRAAEEAAEDAGRKAELALQAAAEIPAAITGANTAADHAEGIYITVREAYESGALKGDKGDNGDKGDPGETGTAAWSDITGKPDAYPPESHTHSQNDVNGLVTALDGKANTSHTHSQSDVTGLENALNGKASASHSHLQSDVNGLESALAGKASAVHTHSQSDVTGLASALDDKQAKLIAGSNITIAADGRTISASGGGGASTWEEITGKPDAYPPESHTHSQNDVTGLSSALSGKADSAHTHSQNDVNGLSTALSAKQDVLIAGSNITIADDGKTISAEKTTSLEWNAITGKPDTYTPSAHEQAWSTITGKPDTFTPAAHTHIQSDVTGLGTALSAKQDTLIAGSNITIAADGKTISATGGGASTWEEITGKPDVFPPETHGHDISDVDELQTALDGKQKSLTAGTGIKLTDDGNIYAEYTYNKNEVAVGKWIDGRTVYHKTFIVQDRTGVGSSRLYYLIPSGQNDLTWSDSDSTSVKCLPGYNNATWRILRVEGSFDLGTGYVMNFPVFHTGSTLNNVYVSPNGNFELFTVGIGTYKNTYITVTYVKAS